MPPCEARVDGIDYFETPTSGLGPVIYLTVDSPGLMDIHYRIVDAFEAIPELEGDGYVPHITIARGGDMETARELADLEIEPITWTINELHFWDAEHQERVRRIPLPV